MTRDRDDILMDNLFAEARAHPPVPSQALMARILADAEAEAVGVSLSGTGWRAGWRAWLVALGGLPGLGGMVTATCVGFWLGLAPPEGLPDLAGQVFGDEMAAQEEMIVPGLTGFGWDFEEGQVDGTES